MIGFLAKFPESQVPSENKIYIENICLSFSMQQFLGVVKHYTNFRVSSVIFLWGEKGRWRRGKRAGLFIHGL